MRLVVKYGGNAMGAEVNGALLEEVAHLRAAGISGQDGGMIRVRRALSPSGGDLGFVGEIAFVNPAPLLTLLEAGYLPIVSPIAVDEKARHAYRDEKRRAFKALAAQIDLILNPRDNVISLTGR